MPSSRPIRFHLLTALPLEVAFKSVTYRLVLPQVTASGNWQLELHWPGGFWLCAHAGSEEALRTTVYREGLELEQATVARTIFERLVKQGRAKTVGACMSAP